MKYVYLGLLFIMINLSGCSGDKKDKNTTEETVETILPDEISEVTVIPLQETRFHHELISNGKLSAGRLAELRFETAEAIAAIYVKNGERVKKGQKLASLSSFRLANKTAQQKEDRDMLPKIRPRYRPPPCNWCG